MIGENKRGATRGSEDRMHEKKSLSARVDEFLGGKGFYIVLFVCIAVIGVSAWLLLFSRFSPLAPDDVGDYVDAMGDLPPKTTPSKPTAPKATPGATEPEHQVPEDTKPAVTPPPQSGALAVQDTTKPTEPPDTKPSEPPATDAEVRPEDLIFAWPVSGAVAAPYSPDELIYNATMDDWRTHDGIDIEASRGATVLAPAAGTVTAVYTDDMLGSAVVIDHGAGVVSVSANLAAAPAVKVGDHVALAAPIGSVGDTALGETGENSHLHFSLTVNGRSVDPTKFLPQK